ncbi:MAG: acylneuraminate cytidylyltransferase family protein [bacterium]|nr:acylneuraminate cytidylyltransferase family protein [bacterium]
MYKQERILAIIPARAGSKGLPGKNKKIFCGKPLIAWTILAAQGSKYIDNVVVSTDDDFIIQIAKYYGAEVPFKRPALIAGDDAKAIEVIRHTMDFFEAKNKPFDHLIYLHPTSPLRRTVDIDGAIEYFFEKQAETVVGVCKTTAPYLINTLQENLEMKDFLPKRDLNRQDFKETYYKINGAFYMSQWQNMKETGDWFVEKSYGYVMDKQNSIDIDDELDLQVAGYLKQKQAASQ